MGTLKLIQDLSVSLLVLCNIVYAKASFKGVIYTCRFVPRPSHPSFCHLQYTNVEEGLVTFAVTYLDIGWTHNEMKGPGYH